MKKIGILALVCFISVPGFSQNFHLLSPEVKNFYYNPYSDQSRNLFDPGNRPYQIYCQDDLYGDGGQIIVDFQQGTLTWRAYLGEIFAGFRLIRFDAARTGDGLTTDLLATLDKAYTNYAYGAEWRDHEATAGSFRLLSPNSRVPHQGGGTWRALAFMELGFMVGQYSYRCEYRYPDRNL